MLHSVTRILSPYANFSMVSDEVLTRASEKGNRVHAAAAAYALDFPVDGLQDGDEGYFDSFRVWFDTTVDTVIAVEQEYVSEQYGIVGHPDLVCTINGDDCRVVVDLKTPRTVSKSWALQLAAYAHLTASRRAFSLRLNPDGGRAIVDEVTDIAKCFAIFLNALSVFKYFHPED